VKPGRIILKLKLISCEVLEREATHCLDEAAFEIDFEYTKKSAHEKPELLQKSIQEIIDCSDDYDALLLGFGLCGNALNGIRARKCRLVVPRAHDCCTLFLGSKQRFNELFEGRESMPWGSTGYCEKDGEYLRNTDTGSVIGYDKTYDEYVEKYGKENAEYIWDSIHPKNESKDVIFINIPETYNHEVYRDFEKEIHKEDKVITIEPGNLSLMRKLLMGKWDDDFLIVEPGCEISAVYDKDEIVCSKLVKNDKKW